MIGGIEEHDRKFPAIYRTWARTSEGLRKDPEKHRRTNRSHRKQKFHTTMARTAVKGLLYVEVICLPVSLYKGEVEGKRPLLCSQASAEALAVSGTGEEGVAHHIALFSIASPPPSGLVDLFFCVVCEGVENMGDVLKK